MKIYAPTMVLLLLLGARAEAADSPPVAAAKGAPAPSTSPRPDPWPRPRVLMRLVIDPPFGAGVDVTVFPSERWSASVDLIHRGPFGPFYEVGCHFWPRRPRGTHHDLGVGVGGDLLFTLDSSTGGFAALFLHSVDVHYLMRPRRGFGLVFGGKGGFGPTFEARDFGARSRSSSALDHLGFQRTNYVGLSLGDHP